MTETNTERAIRLLACVAKKDLDKTMSFFTEDAVFCDPHYPKTQMQGQVEITKGLRWGFNGLKKMGFDIVNTYPSADGEGVVISVHTRHKLPNGKPLNFPQLFVFEFEGQRIKSLNAYVQYEPHGVVGLMLRVARLRQALSRLKSKLTEQTQDEL